MLKRYSTLIIDDEPLALERLEKLLLNFSEIIDVIGTAKNGKDAKQKIETLQPDLIFLDIEMPLLRGFQLIEQLETIPLIVFCTAYNEYALKAFETNSIDYLVKPVRLERIEKTIKKLKSFNAQSEAQQVLEVIKKLSIEESKKTMTSISVKKGDKLIFIKLEHITCFKADEKYVKIITSRGDYITDISLTHLEKKLPNYFLRVHRGCIINTHFVVEIQKYFNSRFIIRLKNKGVVSITSGRSYLQTMKDWIG